MMSLEAILAAIEAAGAAGVAEQERRTARQVAEIQAEAARRAVAGEAAACQAARRPAEAEATRLLSQAALEAAQQAAEAREAFVQSVLEGVRRRLGGLRDEPLYPALLDRLAREALQALGEEEACLIADPRDKPLLGELVSGLAGRVSLELSLRSWGGVIACSRDGLITVDNTLETRLERALPAIRRDLAAFLQEIE